MGCASCLFCRYKPINIICKKQFNVPLIPEGVLVLLNKAPYDDRMDEIIVGGKVLGSIRYEVERQDFVLLPRIEGADIISAQVSSPVASLVASPVDSQSHADHVKKSHVVIDESAVPFILKGASLLAPGIKAVDPSIRAGNEVIITSDDVGCLLYTSDAADEED